VDTSCGYLIDVTSIEPGVAPSVRRDATQPPYDGEDDALVAVQNDTTSQLDSIHIGVAGSRDKLMNFDGDGLCSEKISPKPAECPFGPGLSNPFDYQGPDTEILPESGDAGEVFFPEPLQPGQSTYFSLEAAPNQPIAAGALNDTISTTLTNSETGESGTALSAPGPVAMTDRATINGADAATAAGTVQYSLYSDASCTKLVERLGPKNVAAGGVAEPSNPSSVGLAADATYYWQVTYSGDGRNSPNESACGTETMTFGTPPELARPSITTRLSGGAQTGAHIEVGEGTPVTDTALITAPGGAPVSGRVTYAAYASPHCTGTPVTGLGTGGATTGDGPSTNAVTLPAGTYYFQAFYSGSATLQPATTPCGSEVLTVVALTQPIITGPPPPSSTGSHSGPAAFILTARVSDRSGRIVIVTELPGTGSARAIAVISSGAPRAASKARCARVKGRRRCVSSLPSYGASSLAVPAAGTYTLVINPASAVQRTLRLGRTLRLVLTLTFQSRAGGPPVTRILDLVARIRTPRHDSRRRA